MKTLMNEKGLIVKYLMNISGYSRQHLTRQISQYRNGGKRIRRQPTTHALAVDTPTTISSTSLI
jgi:hypothetical protein